MAPFGGLEWTVDLIHQVERSSFNYRILSKLRIDSLIRVVGIFATWPANPGDFLTLGLPYSCASLWLFSRSPPKSVPYHRFIHGALCLSRKGTRP